MKTVKGRVKAGELKVLRHDVAGVDLGSREHYVCAPSSAVLSMVFEKGS